MNGHIDALIALAEEMDCFYGAIEIEPRSQLDVLTVSLNQSVEISTHQRLCELASELLRRLCTWPAQLRHGHRPR